MVPPARRAPRALTLIPEGAPPAHRCRQGQGTSMAAVAPLPRTVRPLVLLLAFVALNACSGPPPRTVLSEQQLSERRAVDAAAAREGDESNLADAVERLSRQWDDQQAGRRAGPPTLE